MNKNSKTLSFICLVLYLTQISAASGQAEGDGIVEQESVIANYSFDHARKNESNENGNLSYDHLKVSKNRFGKNNKACMFDSDDDYLDISSILNDLSQLQGASFSFWMRLNDNQPDQLQTFIHLKPETPILRINPTLLDLGQKGPMTTTIELDQAIDIQGFEVTIRFNPELLKAVHVVYPDAFKITIPVKIDHQNGLIQIAAAAMQNDPVTGKDVVLASITWEVIANGDACIEIIDAILANPAASKVPFSVTQSCTSNEKSNMKIEEHENESKINLSIENRRFLYHFDTSEQQYNLSSNSWVRPDRWHFVVLTVDNNATHLYVNNEKVISRQNQQNIQNIFAQFKYLYIGHPYENTFRGVMDEFNVYDHALSNEEIINLYYTACEKEIYIANLHEMKTALNLAKEHSFLCLEDGRYYPNNYEIEKDIQIEKTIHLRSIYGPDNCYLIGSLNIKKSVSIYGLSIINFGFFDFFKGNIAAITIENAAPDIINCAIMYSDKHGIYCSKASPHIVNTIIVSNYEYGIYAINSTLNISYSTIADNHEAGIFVQDSTLKMSNSIIWNNKESLEKFEYGINTIHIRYSDIQGGHPGLGNMNQDPLFDSPIDGNYHLQDNSPCLDSAESLFETMHLNLKSIYLFTDMLGNQRPSPAGSLPDMGALENKKGKKDLYIIYPSQIQGSIQIANSKDSLFYLLWDTSNTFDFFKVSIFKQSDLPAPYEPQVTEPQLLYFSDLNRHELNVSSFYQYMGITDEPMYIFLPEDNREPVVSEWTRENHFYMPLDSFDEGNYVWRIQGVPGKYYIEGSFSVYSETSNTRVKRGTVVLPGVLVGMILSFDEVQSVYLGETKLPVVHSKTYAYTTYFGSLLKSGEQTLKFPDSNFSDKEIDIPETGMIIYYTDDSLWREIKF